MKSLVFAFALTLSSLAAFARDNAPAVLKNPVTVTQDTYTEIAVEELPEAVARAVSKNYPTAAIDRAFVSQDKKYKLELSLKDGTTGTFYADEQGNWLDQ